MAMRCPQCGNELSQDEAFCGQCGAATMQQGQATEMMQAPPSGSLNAAYYHRNSSPPPTPGNYPNNPGSGMYPSSDSYKTQPAPTPGNPISSASPNPKQPNAIPQVPQAPVSGSQQSTSFYQDATEAMPMPQMPSAGGQPYANGYPQQSFGAMPQQGNYPAGSQVGGQPFQQGNFTQHPYPTPSSQPFQSAPPVQGYGYDGYGNQPPRMTPPPKKQNNTFLIVAIVILVVALIIAAILGTLFVLNRNSSPQTSITPTTAPTTQPTAAPTTAPTPTATPITPTPVPSPTVAPTATPFAGYSWCGTACATNGFLVQYPVGWNQQQTQDQTGIEFLNPTQQDEYAAFKTPGATTSTADALVTNDLQANFASKPGYTPPTGTKSTTIGGVTWVYQIASYQLNNQPEQIEVYATVYQGKGYIIELQAASSQFNAVNTQYYATMIGSFQFYQPTS
jgi:hypothetical protein